MVTFSITFFSSSSNTVQGSVEHYRTGDFTLNDPKPDNQVFFKPFFNPTDGPVDVTDQPFTDYQSHQSHTLE